MADRNALADTYEAERGVYEAFTANAHELIRKLLYEEHIDVFSFEHRTKSVDSVQEKLTREDKRNKYKDLADLTDLSGVRIITYLAEDCDRVAETLKSAFVVDEVNSVDKESELDPDRFGYQSTHLVLSYSEDRLTLPEFKRFQGLKLEVQVKTLLQHAWAAIDWKLRYKSSVEAPKKLRRRLYRISALLEAADDDFSYVSNETVAIRINYEAAIERGDLAVGIDRESVEAFLNAEPQLETIRTLTSVLVEPKFKFTLKPVTENGARNLVKTLNYLRITSLDELSARLNADPGKQKLLVQRLWESWGANPSSSSAADIVRLILILNSPKKVAIALVEKIPFSEPFTKAVLSMLRP